LIEVFYHRRNNLFTSAYSGGGGNFVLSTSLMGYMRILGGTVPMCPKGYGVFYTIEEDT
jgi:hypothetical protein